jgi:regulator of cell morphogenesis and NO signaling
METQINAGTLLGDIVAADIRAATVFQKAGNDFNEWPLDFLADYIINTHHQYVRKTLPGLLEFTEKIARVHGDHHPELLTVATLFGQVGDELTAHMKKEESVLFPAIRAVWKEPQHQARGILRPAIAAMVSEHEFAGGALDRIGELTGGYQVPDDGCQTYRATMTLLEQFENDLHIHVHLENNILFPKALNL